MIMTENSHQIKDGADRYSTLYEDIDKVKNYLNTGSNFGGDGFSRWYDNEEVVAVAIMNDPSAFRYASERLRGDRDFALKAIIEDGYCLKFVSLRLSEDRDFIFDVVRLNSENLLYVSADFKDDEKIVLEAVKQDEGAILYASQRLRDMVNSSGTVKVIESSILSQELRQSLIAKPESVKTKKMKI